MCVHSHVCMTYVAWLICGHQRLTCESWSSPSTMWCLGMELRSSGKAEITFYLLGHLTALLLSLSVKQIFDVYSCELQST